MGYMSVNAALSMRSQISTVLWIHILGILQFFIESKAQAVLALVTDRQVWEDEVASRAWAIEVGDTTAGYLPRTNANSAANARLMKYAASTRPTVRKN